MKVLIVRDSHGRPITSAVYNDDEQAKMEDQNARIISTLGYETEQVEAVPADDLIATLIEMENTTEEAQDDEEAAPSER